MRSSDKPTYYIAAALSVIVLYTVYAVGFAPHYVGKLPPNEVGEWLWGLASTLAFIWLVAGFHLQRRQLNAQREEFRRMAIVNCMTEARELVLSTLQSEVDNFKIDFSKYKDWNIGFAFLTTMVLRRKESEPTSLSGEDAVSDEALGGAIYAIDICTEAMYQACRMYVEVVHGDSSFPPHVPSLSKRSELVVKVIDLHKLPCISRYRLPLSFLSELEIDGFVSKYLRLFGNEAGYQD